MTERTRTLEERVAILEEHLTRVEAQLDEIIHGQGAAAEQIVTLASDQAAALKAEAERVREQMLEQSQAILGVSTSMVKLQQAIQKWAAAGTLAGAVLLYIIAKAAGL
jgi:capsule polysaccharide export protein KpsE/RkpR